jgi:hypothetical protein
MRLTVLSAVLCLSQLSATSLSTNHLRLQSSRHGSVILESSVDTLSIPSSSLRTSWVCLRRRGGRIAPNHPHIRSETLLSCDNLRLRGGSIALNHDEELEHADQALRSMSTLNSDQRSGDPHTQDDEPDENDLHPTPFPGYAEELQAQLQHQDFRNGICIRTAQITDIMDMQRINLVCLPENYQVVTARHP